MGTQGGTPWVRMELGRWLVTKCCAKRRHAQPPSSRSCVAWMRTCGGPGGLLRIVSPARNSGSRPGGTAGCGLTAPAAPFRARCGRSMCWSATRCEAVEGWPARVGSAARAGLRIRVGASAPAWTRSRLAAVGCPLSRAVLAWACAASLAPSHAPSEASVAAREGKGQSRALSSLSRAAISRKAKPTHQPRSQIVNPPAG